MEANNQRVFSQHIEKFDLAETRGILALLDFKTLKTSGTRYNKLYIDDGNNLNFYEGSLNSGEIVVGEKEVPVSINLQDVSKNKSTISFTLSPSDPVSEIPTLEAAKNDLNYDILENPLVISAKPCMDMK